jgi:HPt (histidine-containing phosphotransfer) domain-containing protein
MQPEYPNQESSPIDVQELLDRCMGNINLAERVLAKLQSRFAEDMIEFERALTEKNGTLLTSIAHRLKGAASNVAAHDLQMCAAKIEESGRKGQMEDLPAQLDILRNQWSRLNEATLSGVTSNISQ